MNKVIEILEQYPFELEDGDKIYSLSRICELFEVKQLDDNTWVATTGGGYESFLNFAFFYFNYSNCGTSTDTGVTLLFNGVGNDYLGELRHTWFSDYYFYITPKSMIECFKWLDSKFKED